MHQINIRGKGNREVTVKNVGNIGFKTQNRDNQSKEYNKENLKKMCNGDPTESRV